MNGLGDGGNQKYSEPVVEATRLVEGIGEPLITDAPLGLDEYQPEDMQEKYWAWRYPDGFFMSMWGGDLLPGAWRIASRDPNDLLSAIAAATEWQGTVHPQSGRLVQVTIHDLLSAPARTGCLAGVSVVDGYPNVARYIEARPGDLP